MRGVYSIPYRISAVNTARTLAYITVASGKPVEILSTEVTNESNETNEQLVCCWQRITTLGTPTATSVTPTKLEPGDGAAAGTYKCNVTASEPTYGSIAQGSAPVDVHGLAGYPSLPGYFFKPDPEWRPLLASGDSWGLRLLNAPTALDLCINVVVREVG
jgi:hypothetical protein